VWGETAGDEIDQRGPSELGGCFGGLSIQGGRGLALEHGAGAKKTLQASGNSELFAENGSPKRGGTGVGEAGASYKGGGLGHNGGGWRKGACGECSVDSKSTNARFIGRSSQ